MRIFVLIFLTLVLISCNYINTEKEISQGLYFFPGGLDPAINTDFYEYQIFSQIYEPLLTLDGDYQTLLPCLADHWSVSEDNLTYTFQLKPNILFHDGSPLTSEAAEYSFKRQIGLRSSSPPISFIDTIYATSPLTLKIRLNHPYLPFLYSLASPNGLLVMSQRALEKYGDKIGRNPVGTGPFYLDHFQDKKYITLRAFSAYREKCTINKITYTLPDSSSQSETMFKNEELDVLYMVPGHLLDRLKWLGRVEYFVQKPLNTIYLGFNLKNSPVNNIEFRRAILMAIDTKSSVYFANRGNAVPAVGPIPPVFSGYGDLKQKSYNPEMSLKLLRDAGYKNGLSLNLYVFLPIFSRQVKIEILKSQLKKVGITINTTFFNDWEKFADAVKNKECHIFFDGFSSELIGDPGYFLYSLFHSASTDNRINYENKKIDHYLELAFQEVDEQKRHEIYRSIVKIVLNDTPAVYDSHVKSVFAFNSKKIKSLNVNPYEFIYYHRLETYE